jgi:hypothetical protein
MSIAILITLLLGIVKCIQNRKHAGYTNMDRNKKKTNGRDETDMTSLSTDATSRMDSFDAGV